jgi:hypothetical protein
MSHSLHRHGSRERLRQDYTFYARTSRYVNREGCGPKLRKILEILLEGQQVNNFGSSHAGKSYVAGLKPEEYALTLDTAYGLAACFSEQSAIRSLLAKLKEADTGISIVVSGLIDELGAVATEVGLTPHTVFLSLGVHGKRARLPEERLLEITTMCGHGQVASRLTRAVSERVRAGKMTAEAGARLLAQPCPCGIFNTTRCAKILEAGREAPAGGGSPATRPA